MTVAPTASITERIPVTLWAGRLSITTHAPGLLVGYQYLFHISFKGQCVTWLQAKSFLQRVPVAPLHQSRSSCYRVDRERRYTPWPLSGREHNAKVIAKLEPVSSTNTKSCKFTALISCQYCARNCCTRSVSRSVACKVFFSGELELLNDVSHCGSKDSAHPPVAPVGRTTLPKWHHYPPPPK